MVNDGKQWVLHIGIQVDIALTPSIVTGGVFGGLGLVSLPIFAFILRKKRQIVSSVFGLTYLYIIVFTMDKFAKFFSLINLLDNSDFLILSQHATFDIKLPSDGNGRTILIIKPHKVIPIDLFKRLYTNIRGISNQIVVRFESKIVDIDLELLIEYIRYYLELTSYKSIIIENILIRKNISVLDSGVIIFQYFNKLEMNEIKNIEKGLITFLKSVGLFVTAIDFEFDKERKELETHKIKKDESNRVTHLLPSEEEILIAKCTKFNAIEKPNNFTEIKELFVTDKKDRVRGQIFKIDIKPTKKGAPLFIYSITDYNSAISIFASSGIKTGLNKWKTNDSVYSMLPVSYLNTFKVGDWILADVTQSYDLQSNTNQQNGWVNKIIKITPPMEFNPADDELKPRIELLAHTNMSSMDGLIKPESLIQRVRNWNWKAVGVTDRYNVQAFPELSTASKKFNKKVIYGCEFDLAKEHIDIVRNPKGQNLLNAEYIIFDIETTGLYNEFDEMIEFGAIKVKNGIVSETVDWFINPKKPIPSYITEKTHITNEMVDNQDTIKPSLKKIVDFIGDAVLIAHNGINFDIRFINKKLEQNNMPLINNTLIDTMQLSRALNTDLMHHNLGVVSRNYKIKYDEDSAHRADWDARVLYSVWQAMMNHMDVMGIKTVDDINDKLQSEKLQTRQFGQFVEIYCRNQDGVKDLYRLVSLSCTQNLYGSPRLMRETLCKKRWNLIVVNSPTESDVWDIAVNGTKQELIDAINFYDYIFVAPPRNLLHEVQRNIIREQDVKKTINKIITTANLLNKKVIAVSDSYYLDIWDQVAHKVYVHSKQLGGKRHRLFRYNGDNNILPDLHLRSTCEMLNEFAFLKDEQLINQIVIDNTYEFVSNVQDGIQPLRSGSYRPKIDNVADNLKKAIYEKIDELYGDKVHPEITNRVATELHSIIKHDYSIIYWIAKQLVQQSLKDGYLVGSRGSVGSSLVAFLAGISEVNPLKPHYRCHKCKHVDFNVSNHADGYDLEKRLCPVCGSEMFGDGHNIPFETFLGFENDPKVPDIDLNFSGEYQSKAHDFIKHMFGETHTFRAGTISTVADKTAFGYVKNYFEITQPNETIPSAVIDWISSKCVDVKRTTGQHPGGIIIVPKHMDILDFTPYNYPADDKTLSWHTTHFAFESIHDNLLKLDILGHDDPTTLKMLEESTGKPAKDIPFHDNDVMKLFNSLESLKILPEQILGETVGAIGLPEFGTPFVRRMLATAKPQTFGDLIRISGLSHGTEVWKDNAENLIRKANMKLAEVISCRDDIMLYLISKGVNEKMAFDIMEDVRKGKGKRKGMDNINPVNAKILSKHDVPQWYIDSCNKISYLFPKAHATAYVIMAWRVAWFKIHYPIHYYAAYFSIRPAVFDIQTVLAGVDAVRTRLMDIRQRLASRETKSGVTTKEQDLVTVYEVAMEMFARGYSFKNIDLIHSDATKFIASDKALIPPFKAIDGLGEAAAQSIVEARKFSPFTSKEDLMERTKISKTILGVFNSLGIINDLEEDNQQTLF